jgi:COP9 signalosome complex subunit 1
MAYVDLGNHFYATGDMSSAIKAYTRAKDYCTTSKHHIETCMNLIQVGCIPEFVTSQVYLASNAFAQISLQIIKADSLLESADRQAYQSKLKCLEGLAALDSQKYEKVASCFLTVEYSCGSSFTEV